MGQPNKKQIDPATGLIDAYNKAVALAHRNNAIRFWFDDPEPVDPVKAVPNMEIAQPVINRMAGVAGTPVRGLSAALTGAYTGLNTPTVDYEQKTGLEGLPARALGVMGDVGDAATLGLAGALGRKLASPR